MMTEHDERRIAAIADIALHLAEHGAKNWNLVRDKYPEINERVWWRMIAAVKDGQTPEHVLKVAIAKARNQARRQLPAPPPPDYIAKGGATAVANMDFLVQFRDLFSDAVLLRDWATNTKDDGGRAIKNPMFFAQSIKLRRELLETCMKMMREVYELSQSKELWDTALDEIAAESPETYQRIMKRLAALNASRGLTIHAEVEED